MTTKEAINILQNIDPQCQKDCPISRDDCAKQENKCLVSEALKYAVDFLSTNVVELKRGEWIEKRDKYGGFYYVCSNCKNDRALSKSNFCCDCGADMRGKQNED